MRVNEKQKIIVVAAVFVAIAGGIGTLIYLKVAQRAVLARELSRYEIEEQAARAKIAQIPERMKQKAKLVETIDRYAAILPPEEHAEHTAFVNIIDSYRRDTQILIQKAEYVTIDREKNKSAKKESFVRHRYRFKLLGSVPDFLEFVGKIENHTRFMKVDAFNIRPFGSTGQMNKSTGSRNDKVELTKAEKPLKEIDLTVSTYTYVRGVEKEES